VSFLVGKTNTKPNVSGGTSDMHNMLLEFIKSQGLGGLNPGTNPDPSQIEPYQKLFRDQNAQNFGQVKESAGTLTGSGLGNQLGIAGQRASTEQGAFLADMIERRRQADANRWMQVVLGTLGSPAGGVHETYTPGFLDYAMEGLQTAASFMPGGGGSPTPARQRGDTAGANMQSGGQLGQASIYNFIDKGYDGTPFGGYGPDRDSFGTHNTYFGSR
jgi:hypothetical protein